MAGDSERSRFVMRRFIVVASDPRTWIATLRQSHDRLDKLVRSLTPEQVRAQSYDTEWSIAQVLSHLGSGAEIALLTLPGALREGEPVGRDEIGRASCR